MGKKGGRNGEKKGKDGNGKMRKRKGKRKMGMVMGNKVLSIDSVGQLGGRIREWVFSNG